MNIYKTKFRAKCPADGQVIEYSLLVRAKTMILAETILKEVDCIQSGYHEDIADRLFASLGAEIILSASHQGVSIVAVRK